MSFSTEALFVFAAIVGVPALIARFLVRATWLQVGCAFVLWTLILAMLLGGGSVSSDEAIGWTLIMGMFFNWLGVPITAIAVRLFNIPYRFGRRAAR